MGALAPNLSATTNDINQSFITENLTPVPSSQPDTNYTWSDPQLNTTADNPYYQDNQSWVINESGHDWVLDVNPANNTNYADSIQFDSENNTFYNFGSQFAILINASDVIFNGMGAILNGGGKTDYGIIVNNQSTALGGISITNITLTGFNIAGIFFNNVDRSAVNYCIEYYRSECEF